MTSIYEMAEEALRSTSIKANFHRLTRLLMRGGVQLLRETLDSYHSPADLPLRLADPRIQAQLNRARLTRTERDCLYPSPGVYGESNDFDITLIFKLFRTICSLTPPPGLRGWDDLPNDSDHTLVADLVRIKYYRNEIYGHRPAMEIFDIDFIRLWEEISEALLRIATNISPAKRDEWEKSIDDLLRKPLTPDEERYIEELETWYMQDMDLKNEFLKLKQGLREELREELREGLREGLREELRSQRGAFVVIQIDVAGHHQAAGSELTFHEPNPLLPEPEQAAGADDPEPNNPPDIDVWNVILSFKESVDLFFRYLLRKLHLPVRNNEVGSWHITVECSSLEVFDGLWEDYCSGHLNSVAQKILITPQVLEKLGLTELKLKTFIVEQKGKKLLEASSGAKDKSEIQALQTTITKNISEGCIEPESWSARQEEGRQKLENELKLQKEQTNTLVEKNEAVEKQLSEKDSHWELFGKQRRKWKGEKSQLMKREMETSGEGTKFQCKLVGITDVVSPEGMDMCAEAFRKLKAQAKKKWQHKERVTLTINLEGIWIEDETSQKVQHMHPVKRISFVTPDPDDEKIFGYVCSQPDSFTGYKFYALKSGNAQIIIDAIVELFEVSVNLRQWAGSAKKQIPRNSSNENQTELQEMRARLSNLQEQLREKDDKLREKEGINLSLQARLNTKNQQLEEKIRLEENLYQKLRAVEEQISQSQAQLREKELEKAKVLKERDRLNGNLRAMHQQLTNSRFSELLKTKMQEQLERKEQQLVESELQLRELNQQLRDLQVQIREKDRATFALRERFGELEEQLATKEQEKNELERSLSTAQQILRDNQAQRSPDWVIPRTQIQLTTKSLGKGAWGEVVQGRFCGCVVAVKTIHNLILSDHNRRLFEREMDIASRCRHPCLLQFIGATSDDRTPLFLTEVMETSLRAVLEERSLSQTEITVIALDVARGLNYLHQKHPIPILHRDISSANVLLWRQGTQWRAKVSDHGTANFKKQTMTVAPGTPIYSAPEARATNQTVQVDVYSFGVLLCEMSIRELPDPERREQQVAMVANNVLRALIRGCLETDPQARPTMEEIIDEIEPEAQGTF